MRPVKFKAWSNKFNKMFRVKEICMDRDGYTHGTVDSGFVDEHYPQGEEWNSPYAFMGRVDFIKPPDGGVSGLMQHPDDDPFILIQSTGLADKDGTEIYDGYILETDCKDHPDDNQEFEGDLVVVQNNLSRGCILHYVFDWCGVSNNITFADAVTNYKVVGNIYEHPHLVERI